MDNEFPSPLFTCFYDDGPPDQIHGGNIGGWKGYKHVLRPVGQSPEWQAQNQVKGERWLPTQPIVVPLIPPNKADVYSLGPHTKTKPKDFLHHMQNFYLDHSTCAFQAMGHLLSGSFYTREKTRMRYFRHWKKNFLKDLKYTGFPLICTAERTQSYVHIFDDVLHDIPPALLAELLHEELVFQREQEQFSEVFTGGALGCFSFSETNDFQEGCVVFPSNPGLQTLNFHKVELKSSKGDFPQLKLKGQPISHDLNGPIRQVSIGTPQEAVYVGVRSDHFCSAWRAGDWLKPRGQEVIQINQPATCLTVSPHVPKELLVASESGAVHLWSLGKGLTKVREEDSNLYFNAKSTWRWCEFSSHPRIMVYADRTGADLTDIRTSEDHSCTLFRIGKISQAKLGERVILSQYLSRVHAHHHLFTTQFSTYIMDDRMPSIPMLKWDHCMASPPMFAQVLAGTSPQSNNRVLLGSQQSQELMMLQYSGGCDHACVARGPQQKLLCPSETLAHLPARLPHKTHAAQNRLAVPAAGLAAIQSRRHMCVLQLTAAGDVFQQTLRLCSEGPEEDTPQSPMSSKRQSEEEEEEEEEDIGGSQSPASDDSQLDSLPSQRRPPGGLEVVVNDSPECPPISDGQEQPAGIATSLTGTRLQLNKALRKWNEWLSALDHQKAPSPPFSHCVKLTKDLDLTFVLQRGTRKKATVQSVRQDLRAGMSRRKVLTHSATHLPPLTVTPVPEVVEPSEWADDLSQRLSAAWQGGWRQWWEDKLGLNREQKRLALHRRRQQRKAKARPRVLLSQSFTSFVSYPEDSQNSVLAWCNSQEPGSDWDEGQRVASHPVPTDGAVLPELTLTTDTRLSEPLFQSTQSSAQEANAPHLPATAMQGFLFADPSESPPLFPLAESSQASVPGCSQKRPQQTQQDILESLFSSQEPSQALLEETPQSSYQFSSFSSQRPPQIRASLSQASRPKKKARMGF